MPVSYVPSGAECEGRRRRRSTSIGSGTIDAEAAAVATASVPSVSTLTVAAAWRHGGAGTWASVSSEWRASRCACGVQS